jgi:hypothetical protein
LSEVYLRVMFNLEIELQFQIIDNAFLSKKV